MLWTVGELRAGRRLQAGDIARRFEMDIRTAYRDVESLKDSFRAPIEYDRTANTYVLTEPTYSLPLVTLSQGELFALYFAEKVLRQYRGTPYERDLESAFRKVADFLPDRVTVDPRSLEHALSVDLGPVSAPDAATFRTVVDALLHRRRLAMTYTSLSRDRTAERKVDPYHVYNRRGDWYLAAFDPSHREVRDFALPRIRAARLLEHRYEIPEDFDLGAYLSQAFGVEKGRRPVNVAIRFSAHQARWIRERAWHPTARIQERLDGGCVLRMKVSGLAEVKRWVLQYGAEAEVLAPKELRDEVRREVGALTKAYER